MKYFSISHNFDLEFLGLYYLFFFLNQDLGIMIFHI